MKRHVQSYALAFVCGALLLNAGCALRQDVSHDARFTTDYVVGATYRVQRTLLARQLGGNLALFTSRSDWERQKRRPKNEEYSNLEGLVAPGTLLKVTKLDWDKTPQTGRVLWVWGKCVSG